MIDRSDEQRNGGTTIGRRHVLTLFLAAGVLTPFVGTGTAHASEDDVYPIPEESGSIPWW